MRYTLFFRGGRSAPVRTDEEFTGWVDSRYVVTEPAACAGHLSLAAAVTRHHAVVCEPKCRQTIGR